MSHHMTSTRKDFETRKGARVDWLSRVVMNSNGVGTSTVITRHDYLPFGEEIGAGTGLRSSTQGFGASDTNRRKYGLTERDDTTGLRPHLVAQVREYFRSLDFAGSLQRQHDSCRSAKLQSLQLRPERSEPP